MPFKSQKQWKWAWANKLPWAREASHKSRSFKSLPKSKHSGKKGRRTR